MPCKEAKARKLLKNNLAILVKKEPFIIQLMFECENKTQDITLGVDLRKLDGTSIHKSANFKQLKIIQKRNSLLTERRWAIPTLN